MFLRFSYIRLFGAVFLLLAVSGFVAPLSVGYTIWASEGHLPAEEFARMARAAHVLANASFVVLLGAGALFSTLLPRSRFRWVMAIGVVAVTLVVGWAVSLMNFAVASTRWMGWAREWHL